MSIKGLDKYLTQGPEDNGYLEMFGEHVWLDNQLETVYLPKTTPDDVFAEVDKYLDGVCDAEQAKENSLFFYGMEQYERKRRNKPTYSTHDTDEALRYYETMLYTVRQHLLTNYQFFEQQAKL